MKKNEVAGILEEIGILLEIKEDNPFKSRAYINGARIVLNLEEDLETLVSENRLTAISGIGQALSGKITEYVRTGKLQYYEELKASIPAGLMEMLRVPGLGPKKVRILYEKLGITNLRSLEYACKENRLVELPGFGVKTQEKVLAGIEYLKTFQGQYYYAEALGLAWTALEPLRQHPGVTEASLAGSIRRAKEVVGDIDLVAAAENTAEITGFFSELPQVREVVSCGETMTSVLLDSGIRADLRVVKPREYPYALHHFTGSKEHNTALRRLAKEKGLKINEYGLFSGEELIPCHTEKELYAALGLNYIPPELRENTGEIEAAQHGPLPELLKVGDIKGIFHLHTTYSDGSNSIAEMVEEALRYGYEYIGISDHSQTAAYAGGLKAADIRRQHEEIRRLREVYPKIAICFGIESDIRFDGALDYPDDLLADFDFVIASVHSQFRMTEEDMTKRIVKAMSHPAVTMLGHATGRILLAREGYPVNIEVILKTALEHGVIMELNASPARLDLDWRHLKKAKEMGVLISINPDAHRIEEINDINYGIAVARKGWLAKEDVFNCYPVNWVSEYLAKKQRNARN